MKSLLQFLLSFCFVSFMLSQETAFDSMHKISGSGVDTAWVRHYGSGVDSSYVDASSLVIDNGGNVYVTGKSKSFGTSYDYATVKYNADGDMQWVRRYNGTGNGNDKPNSLAVDVNGNVYVTGSSYSGTSDDYATIKYNAVGDTQWVRKYNSPENGDDHATALIIDGEENVYVTGESDGYTTIKYNTNGETQWIMWDDAESYGEDVPRALAIDAIGNVYITGAGVTHCCLGARVYFYSTFKYNTNGDSLWWRSNEHLLYSGYGGATSIDVDVGGNVYVAGKPATIKYNANGDTLWVRRFNEGLYYYPNLTLAIDTSGNVFVTGSTEIMDEIGYYTVLAKYNANGDTLWVKKEYNGAMINYLAVDAAGNVYVTGTSGSNIITIKYNGAGNEEWAASYSYGAGSRNVPVGIKVDQSGNVYVGGTSSFGNASIYTVIKYKQTPTAVREISQTIPSSFALEQNYPNPFNPTTVISYQLPVTSIVSLKIYDLLGREIATLVNEEQSAGWKEVQWNAAGFASGMYLVRMNAGRFTQTKKILLMK